MAKYINEQRIVIEALQYDGSKESAEKIKKNFEGAILDEGCYCFLDIYGAPIHLPPAQFEKIFKPITDKRVLLVEKLKSAVLGELKKKQYKGDDWRNNELFEVNKWLAEEFNEASEELYQIDSNHKKASKSAAKMELSHAAICCAIGIDKLDNMEELDEIWKSKEKG